MVVGEDIHLEEALRESHSKCRTEALVDHIDGNQERFDELIGYVLCDDKELASRAAWVMERCIGKKPELAKPHLSDLIARLSEPGSPPAVRRNITRFLQEYPIPEKQLGPIFDICYNLVNNPDETAAVRAYSMTVLGKICVREPELAEEILMVIRQHFPHGTAAFKARGKRVIRELEKLVKTIS